MIEKVKSHHRERKAVLYVRQSSAYQVAHNQESGKLQYAMRQRLEPFSSFVKRFPPTTRIGS